MNEPTVPMDLLTQTYALVDAMAKPAGSLTAREIARGAGVDVNWFFKFKQRRIESPGVDKVQALYNYLLNRSSPAGLVALDEKAIACG